MYNLEQITHQTIREDSDLVTKKAPLGRMNWLGASALAMSAMVSPAHAEDVKLTMWAWMGYLEPVIEAYEAQNPGVDVDLLSVGNGQAHYQKMRSALRGGSDAPDIAQVELFMVDTFRQINALADMNKHGLEVEDNTFVDWAWKQVQADGGAYALPSDGGPMTLLYREDILSDLGIETPVTWEDYYEAAKIVRASGKGYITNASFSDGGWNVAMLWQAGWAPFEIDGQNIKLSIYDDAAKKFAAYWQRLVDEDLISTTGEWTPEWYAAFNDGTTASWVTASWGPLFLAGVAEDSAGKWRVTQMPQWDAGQTVSSNWGGSTIAVLETSEHKEAATAFVQWLLAGEGADMISEIEPNFFSFKNEILSSDTFLNREFDFLGGQMANKVFVESSEYVDTSFKWSPFQDYLHSVLGAEMAKAATGEQTFEDAFLEAESQLKDFVFSQGFDLQD